MAGGVDKQWFADKYKGKGLSLRMMAGRGRDGSARSFSCAQWERNMTISDVAKIATILDVSKAEILARINTEEGERVLSAKQKENTGPARESKHPGFGLPGAVHGDPMNRILISTARTLDLILVTSDRPILKYGADGNVRTLAC